LYLGCCVGIGPITNLSEAFRALNWLKIIWKINKCNFLFDLKRANEKNVEMEAMEGNDGVKAFIIYLYLHFLIFQFQHYDELGEN
jgi:hypothetical protein